jgi:transposase
MRPYSEDLCLRILAQLLKGKKPAEVARSFEVHRVTVYRIWWRHQKGGPVAGRLQGGHRRSQLLPHQARIEQWIEKQPDLTIEQLHQRCVEQLGLAVHPSTVGRFIGKLGYSFKKNAAGQRTRAR